MCSFSLKSEHDNKEKFGEDKIQKDKEYGECPTGFVREISFQFRLVPITKKMQQFF
jgi:hypothetical protein